MFCSIFIVKELINAQIIKLKINSAELPYKDEKIIPEREIR